MQNQEYQLGNQAIDKDNWTEVATWEAMSKLLKFGYILEIDRDGLDMACVQNKAVKTGFKYFDVHIKKNRVVIN